MTTEPHEKTERYILGDLKLDTALHVGAGKGGDPTDSPLRRTGDGRVVLPGRALGGALRTLATRLAPRLGLGTCQALKADGEASSDEVKPCRCDVCRLFGDVSPNEDDSSETGGIASRLWISDAHVKSADPQTQIRDGVGIARDQRAAARNVKFDYEVVPPGTTFGVRLRLVDDESEPARARAMLLAAALAEWEAGRGRLGGSAARGLGRFMLRIEQCVRTEVCTGDQLVAFLKTDRPWTVGTDDSEWWQRMQVARQGNYKPASDEHAPVARGFATVEFDVSVAGPFLINDPLIAALSGFDHAPLLEIALGDDRRPVLPGSSLRGTLRSRAEKIARTLATLKWPNRDEFLKRCPACDPLVGQEEAPLASCDSRLKISDDDEVPEGALCLSCRLFGSPRRGSRLWVEDARWNDPAPGADDWKAQDFLAIDRFTGGGQKGAKFDAAPLTKARFTARLTLHDPKEWELGWLLLVLRDLAEGEITIGFGAAKGYGRAQASSFKWTIGYLTEDDLPDKTKLPGKEDWSGAYRVLQAEPTQGLLPADWQSRAGAWVTRFEETVEAYQVDNNLNPLQKDTFFTADGRLLELYGLPRTGV
jgi:CRISPR/Cas system CSM-associated protein Csm3 (group 7 of RAMP superfamily)